MLGNLTAICYTKRSDERSLICGGYNMYTEISNPMDYKVAFYIRLSKDDGGEKESESITNQRSLLDSFAKKNKLDVVCEYVDDGISGTSFDRPDFNRMIDAIHTKKINMIITKDLSRLGRDYIQTGYYLEKFFPENRVRYISLLDGIDTGLNNYNNDITPFKAIMNDMYAKDISKKIRSVKEDKQRKGLFIGGKAAYGYKKSSDEKNKIIINEEVAGIVRRMFMLAFEGKSCHEIAVILNNEKIVTPANYAKIANSKKSIYSDMWSSERISFMLQNQVYIGNMVQGRVKKLNYKSKIVEKIPPQNWIVVENTHEAIIDKDVFDTVQLLIAKRTRTRTRTHEYLLKGLVYCHNCGYLMTVINRKLAGGKEVLYFICRTYQRFTTAKKCTCHYTRVEDVTDSVLEKIKEICMKYLDVSEMQKLGEKEIDIIANQEDKSKAMIKDFTSKIEFLTAKLDQVYTDKLNDILSPEDFERIYSKIKEERQNYNDKLNTLKKQAENKIDTHAKAKELARRFIDEIDVNRELIFSLIDRIEITETHGIIVHWSFNQLEHLQ